MLIFWNKPPISTIFTPLPTLKQDATYNIRIYQSQSGENGTYSQIAEIPAQVSGLDVTSYDDSTGQTSFFYYVRYVDQTTGNLSDRVLARVEMSVREQRLVMEVYQQVPEVMRARVGNDPNFFVIRRAINDGINTINFYPPITSYNLDNLPAGHESIVTVVALAYVYMQQYLGVAIRDINFAGGIPSVNIDRGTKINTAIERLMGWVKEYIVAVKMADYPNPIGLGSSAIAVPQQRIFGMLFSGGGG